MTRSAQQTVVFRATDGLLAFGYTGPAYIGGVPTDTWIAESVAGEIRSTGETGALTFGTFPVRDVGTSLSLLCQRLRAVRPWRRMNGEISAVGWQWDDERERARAGRCCGCCTRGQGSCSGSRSCRGTSPSGKKVFRMVNNGAWPLGSTRWRGPARSGRSGPGGRGASRKPAGRCHPRGQRAEAVHRGTSLHVRAGPAVAEPERVDPVHPGDRTRGRGVRARRSKWPIRRGWSRQTLFMLRPCISGMETGAGAADVRDEHALDP